MSGPEELRALVEEMRALAKRHVNLVKTGAAYAAGELRGASTSTFEIYIGHFREIGKEIEAALTRAESSLASPAGMEGWSPTLGNLSDDEALALASGMSQWERSLKRPDMQEKDRVRGALEACLRMMFACSVRPAAPRGESE